MLHATVPIRSLKKFSISASSHSGYIPKNGGFVLPPRNSEAVRIICPCSGKKIFKELDIACIVGLGDGEEIVGLLLLSGKERGAAYTYGAFVPRDGEYDHVDRGQNACLYERVYESRTDTLAGV